MASSVEVPAIPAEQLEADGVTPRTGSKLYAEKDYWEYRFSSRAEGGGGDDDFEWLAKWEHVSAILEAVIPSKSARVLLVGCGSSSLGADMARAGYTGVVQTDYSAACIASMRSAHEAEFPSMPFAVADMTRLRPDLEAAGLLGTPFDAVLDKAAMDAMLADGGDTWHPPEDLLARARDVCDSTCDVLAPGGKYVQISFAQPHFRR